MTPARFAQALLAYACVECGSFDPQLVVARLSTSAELYSALCVCIGAPSARAVLVYHGSKLVDSVHRITVGASGPGAGGLKACLTCAETVLGRSPDSWEVDGHANYGAVVKVIS